MTLRKSLINMKKISNKNRRRLSSELFTHTGSVRNIFSVIMAAIICPGDPVTQVSDFSKLTKLASGKSPSSINPNSSIYPFQSKRNSSLSNKNFKNYVYDAKLQTLKNMKLNDSLAYIISFLTNISCCNNNY